MIIKKINEKDYDNFVRKNVLKSFYQSIEWYKVKKDEGKKCELLGLYIDEKLVGASLVIYSRILKKYYYAYASRGFLYDYQNLLEFKNSLKMYFKKKKVVFFRMDPPIILATYDKDLKKDLIWESNQLIESLKYYGFRHYGFNQGFETDQFRFIHRLDLKNNFDEQMIEFSKSTKKNMELAKFRGVEIKKGNLKDIDMANELFNMTADRKKIVAFKKSFYKYIISEFKDKANLYMVYINKKKYLDNLENKIIDDQNKLEELKTKKQHDHVGHKLKSQEQLLLNNIKKWQEELTVVKNMKDFTNIAAMLTITKYDEVVSFISGMDNKYRKFCPKYVMYPEMIKEAILKKLKYVNFLGVKNIFDKNDPDYGMYEVKRSFGGKTIEYIGEFDLPINKFLYFVYLVNRKIKRR